MLRFTVAACGAAVVGVAVLVWAVFFAGGTSGRPNMQVLESNVSAYPVGRRLTGGTVFKLEKGERIKVLLLPSNRTQVFEGPPADAPPPEGGSRSLDGG
jgi:hypothetical protein